MIKVVVAFGTRPEAIKMASVVKELRKYPKRIKTVVVVSGQHRQMLDQVLRVFRIKQDYDLNIMQPQQTLVQITSRILDGIGSIFDQEKPDIVLVHGDTLTAFSFALASFYYKIPVGHVEAGLRTYSKYDPFPEEMNRRLIDVISDYYFAPTKAARDNLLKEGIKKNNIFVTGNTVVDALFWMTKQKYNFSDKQLRQVDFDNKKVILVTVHRRESWGLPLVDIFRALAKIAKNFPEVEIIYPVHPNPLIQKPAGEVLDNIQNIHLLAPLDYKDMILVMKKCFMVMTDSGGLQEEAPALGKPVLVLRKTTERPEGVEVGTLRLVGVNKERIFKEASLLLTNPEEYDKMATAINPYGDGKASFRIREVIEKRVCPKY